jgi:DNA-3-methyladenine glycosylase II
MIIIPTPPIFSFQECYHFLARSPNEILHITQNNKIRKLLKVNDLNILFELNEKKGEGIGLELLNQPTDKEAFKLIAEYVIQWLDLETE